jgi:hypothetical protein
MVTGADRFEVDTEGLSAVLSAVALRSERHVIRKGRRLIRHNDAAPKTASSASESKTRRVYSQGESRKEHPDQSVVVGWCLFGLVVHLRNGRQGSPGKAKGWLSIGGQGASSHKLPPRWRQWQGDWSAAHVLRFGGEVG